MAEHLPTVTLVRGAMETQVSRWNSPSLLASLGYDTSNDDALLKSAERKHKKDVLDPVLVLRDGEPVEVALNLSVAA
ncbi:hypothetical protein OH492_11390 [Vibrio chagasii]|nr:hypothetical protein [Vibrio chagasii]